MSVLLFVTAVTVAAVTEGWGAGRRDAGEDGGFRRILWVEGYLLTLRKVSKDAKPRKCHKTTQ